MVERDDNSELEELGRSMRDRLEIHEVVVRYCRGVDRREARLIEGAFWSDATIDTGILQTTGSAIAEVAIAALEKHTSRPTMHFVGNELVTFAGESAFSETYILSFMMIESGDRTLIRVRGSRFLDTFERRQGSFRIAKRVVVDDWDQSSDATGPSLLSGQLRGTFWPDDVSYSMSEAAVPSTEVAG